MQNIDWTAASIKMLNSEIMFYDKLVDFVNFLPQEVEFLKDVDGKTLIGTLVSRVMSLEEFQQLMLVCYNGLKFQDKFFTNFVSYFRLFLSCMLHFANNPDIHS
ncbi:hypothetical protein [Candidatus Trichorickettsia mobilis]|uniref:hypothetical protein n=1 Tax=Candidatus Trichorickettsia mobilis TaxID=1346319 RepID=UPI0029311963|nr:hypothetical protein [Candidatus Trichorickettsia mobilis]